VYIGGGIYMWMKTGMILKQTLRIITGSGGQALLVDEIGNDTRIISITRETIIGTRAV
jgi:hypothetical protein